MIRTAAADLINVAKRKFCRGWKENVGYIREIFRTTAFGDPKKVAS